MPDEPDAIAPRRMAGRVSELDGIRGLAILLVLIHHYFGLQVPELSDGSWIAVARRATRLSWSGVDLFFVLSGFLIAGILLDHRKASNVYHVFYFRRATRILPLYLLTLAAYYTCVALGLATDPRHEFLFASAAMTAGDTAPPLWRYLTFTQNFAGPMPVFLAATWSLAVEEQFYLVFPAIALTIPRKWLVLVCLAVVMTAFATRFAGHEYGNVGGTFYRMDGLGLGVLVAIAVRWPSTQAIFARFRVLSYAALACLVGLVSAASWNAWQGPWLITLFGAAFAVLVLTAFLDRGSARTWILRTPPLVHLGNLSFALYLFHMPVVGLVHGWFDGSAPNWAKPNGMRLTLAALLISIVLAEISRRCFERPFLAYGKRLRYRSHDAPRPLRES